MESLWVTTICANYLKGLWYLTNEPFLEIKGAHLFEDVGCVTQFVGSEEFR